MFTLSTWLALLLFVLGAVLIIKGGDFFVDAAVWIAEAFGIPKFIIGATVVSLATTLPEIIVSIMAAVGGQTEMAIGNAIGSVTANTGMILAVSLIFMPMVIQRKQIAVKGLILVLSCVSLWLLSYDGLTVTESLVLFLLFAAFIAENIHAARQDPEADEQTERSLQGAGKYIGLFLVGTAMLVIGSRLLVNNGTILAQALGVPERVIAVTMVAIGTSLPELVTAVTAILKRQGSLSVGNILGANIIDITLILPLCALVSRGSLPVGTATLALDMPVCALEAAIAVLPTLVLKKFTRIQGLVMLAIYAAYLLTMFA